MHRTFSCVCLFSSALLLLACDSKGPPAWYPGAAPRDENYHGGPSAMLSNMMQIVDGTLTRAELIAGLKADFAAIRYQKVRLPGPELRSQQSMWNALLPINPPPRHCRIGIRTVVLIFRSFRPRLPHCLISLIAIMMARSRHRSSGPVKVRASRARAGAATRMQCRRLPNSFLDLRWGLPYIGPLRAPSCDAECGGVAQLVRVSACHAEGRGFEPRRSRICRSGNGKFLKNGSQLAVLFPLPFFASARPSKFYGFSARNLALNPRCSRGSMLYCTR